MQPDRGQGYSRWLGTRPVLVSAGLDAMQLEAFRARVGASALGDVLAWLGETVVMPRLVRLVDQSTTRIFDLVQAVKAHSYVDQAPLQEIDIHEGLENTLLLLGHKLTYIIVTQEYDRSLPHITAYGGELNQVWTNLIDNAIAAMGGQESLSE